jgi:anti-sigma factor ChrR (cupin superfamily)
MTGEADNECPQAELVHALAVRALTAAETADMTVHLVTCESCRRDLAALRPIVASFADWPTDVLRPSASLWDRLSKRIDNDPEKRPRRSAYELPSRAFAWKAVAPGISCKLLATDAANARVSMLVRLAPNTEYPPHRHAGVEELHLLDGELFINDRKLHPGDYSIAEAGTVDTRVWSETGCTCVLITSLRDQLH